MKENSMKRSLKAVKKGITNIMSDKMYLNLKYYKIFKKRLDLNNPKTFNEKLQWLKLYDRKSAYTMMVDKYEVKDYVRKKIGEEYVIPTLGIWDSFDEIDFDSLPDKFVLQCTHDSGSTIVVKDKKKMDKEAVKSRINAFLKKNYYYSCREWPYKNVKPKIIAEQNITMENEDLFDYKLMCFNGKFKCSFVCSNRDIEANSVNVTFFDENWNVMPFERHYHKSLIEIKRPTYYEKMIELAEKLAKDIPFVRVDFYETMGKLYFGEITFYPGSGFEEFAPEEWDYNLEEWIKLPSPSYTK